MHSKQPSLKSKQSFQNTKKEKSIFLRTLNSLLDGGKSGVEVGFAIIPGVLIISTLVMILTFGPSKTGEFTGAAYEGIAILPRGCQLSELVVGAFIRIL